MIFESIVFVYLLFYRNCYPIEWHSVVICNEISKIFSRKLYVQCRLLQSLLYSVPCHFWMSVSFILFHHIIFLCNIHSIRRLLYLFSIDFPNVYICILVIRGNTNCIPSAGFYLTHTAFQLCKETHLYGFWPFSTRLGSRVHLVPYHYFDKLLPSGKHGMNDEFSTLVQYHEKGILRLHIDNCFHENEID